MFHFFFVWPRGHHRHIKHRRRWPALDIRGDAMRKTQRSQNTQSENSTPFLPPPPPTQKLCAPHIIITTTQHPRAQRSTSTTPRLLGGRFDLSGGLAKFRHGVTQHTNCMAIHSPSCVLSLFSAPQRNTKTANKLHRTHRTLMQVYFLLREAVFIFFLCAYVLHAILITFCECRVYMSCENIVNEMVCDIFSSWCTFQPSHGRKSRCE